MKKKEQTINQYGEPTLFSISDLERKSFIFKFLNNIKTLSENGEQKPKEGK